MDYKDYIKEEFHQIYIQERDNLANRLIEAKYNLQFLKMVHERSEAFAAQRDVTDRFEVRVVLRRIHVTVAWELVLQIKAFTDDNKQDTLTIPKLHNKMFSSYVKEDRKQELYDEIGGIIKTSEWSECKKIVANISNYRNQIVGHNIFEPDELHFDIREAERVINIYEDLFEVISFSDNVYIERTNDIEGETKNFITAFLDAVLPLT